MLTHRCRAMWNLTSSWYFLTSQCLLKDNKKFTWRTRLYDSDAITGGKMNFLSTRESKLQWKLPVWQPRWTVLLLFGPFRSNSEFLHRAPVKIAFICFLWTESSCCQDTSQTTSTPPDSWWVNTIDIQGVLLPLPWCSALSQTCAAPLGVSLPAPEGTLAAASPSAPAEERL